MPSDKFKYGSSPRVRGTPSAGFCGGHLDRFIPARAGNATIIDLKRLIDAVHPRACGERFHASNTSNRGVGSSPRVRGTH